MRPVILQMGVTLDGYVAGRGGEGDWGLPAEHPEVRAWKVASLGQVGTHIMGRVTYEQMAEHWPNATGEYAAFMNRLPKVVFSATLPAAGWAGSRIARGDLTEEIAALKRDDRVADSEREATPRHHRKSERLTGRAQSLQVPASEH